jgi:putative YhdH/YhfP family quinone oxidoreductase
VAALVDHGIDRNKGAVVVTGGTGGVATIAIRILSRLGYKVVAVTGKETHRDWLVEQGATATVLRTTFVDQTDRPLLRAQWAGGIDTVGGNVLSSLIRSVDHRGCVAACGVVGGAELPITVYPFILRGVTLAGIDSAWCPDDRRREIWRRLAGEWKPAGLSRLATIITPQELRSTVDDMLKGRLSGRTVVRIAEQPAGP